MNKRLSISKALGIFSVMMGALLVTGSERAFAQPAENRSINTYGGSVSEFGPDTIIVRSEGAIEPIRYSYTKTTTYVDEAGQPVSVETVKSGQPVIVSYTEQNGKFVASRVVVSKSPVYVGTVSEFTPETIVVRSTPTGAPIRYTYTKTTTYVDENGNPVSIETVKSGLPVTVYYAKDGDRLVASKVIVRKTTTY